MSSASKLGKGLTALLETTQEEDMSESAEVSIDLLKPNPWQPRRNFDDGNLKELATSIKSQGIIQPLLVRQMPDKTYQVIAGERRLRAAKLVGLKTVPIYVRVMSDEDVMLSTLIENLQRQDLDPIEEALAFKNLREKSGFTQEELSEKIGRSRSSIANSLRLLQLSPAAQEDVRTGILSAGHARALLGINDGEIAETVRKYIVQKACNVRETEDIIAQWKASGTLPWDTNEVSEEEATASKAKPQAKSETPRASAEPGSLARKMEEVFAQVLRCKTKVRGTEEKGKITITYSSADELQQILLKFGASTLGGGEGESTDKANDAESAEPEAEAAGA